MPMSPIGKTRLHCGVQSTPVAVSGIHYAGRCAFLSITIDSDGTNAVTVNIFDNATAAAGTRIGNQNMVFGPTPRLIKYSPILPRLCVYGIYVQVVSAGPCEVSVEYDTGEVEG